jgi:hypothetical protein
MTQGAEELWPFPWTMYEWLNGSVIAETLTAITRQRLVIERSYRYEEIDLDERKRVTKDLYRYPKQ